MGDPVLLQLGINLAGGLAAEGVLRTHVAFAERLRGRTTKRQKELAESIATAISDSLGVTFTGKSIRPVVFDPDVWAALLHDDVDDQRWGTLVYDLLKPNGPSAVEVGEALRKALRESADFELRQTIEEFADLARLRAHADESDRLLRSILERTNQLFERQEEAAAALQIFGSALRDPVGVTESRVFDQAIREHMARLNQSVEELTEEQLRVIEQLHGKHRVQISGTAGSGKTLVAAEKAIRLSRAGIATLLLCHNPHLARHLEQLAAGSLVVVNHFTGFVAQVAGRADASQRDDWTNLEEPTTEALEHAFDQLSSTDGRFAAVIVDEGQDFRDEWWLVVEAAVNRFGVVYVFADSEQALLPSRGLPTLENSLNMSRNCRNSGAVYALMRSACSQLPDASPQLANLGLTYIAKFRRGREQQALRGLLKAVVAPDAWGDSAALVLAGSITRKHVLRDGFEITYPGSPWQKYVRDELRRARIGPFLADDEDTEEENWHPSTVAARLSGLSDLPYPSGQDVALVQQVASEIRNELLAPPPTANRRYRQAAKTLNAQVHSSPPIVTRLSSWGPVLGAPDSVRDDPVVEVAIAHHFMSKSWVAALPRPGRVRFGDSDHYRVSGASDNPIYHVPIWSVAQAKGLEADTIIGIWDGLGVYPNEEFYVMASRARCHFFGIIDAGSVKRLKPRLRDRLVFDRPMRPRQHNWGSPGVASS